MSKKFGRRLLIEPGPFIRKASIPVTYQDDITFAEKEDTVKFLTMHSCKGLEFPLVAIPGAGRAVNEGRKDEEARLLYVVMTRATRELVVVRIKGPGSINEKAKGARLD